MSACHPYTTALVETLYECNGWWLGRDVIVLLFLARSDMRFRRVDCQIVSDFSSQKALTMSGMPCTKEEASTYVILPEKVRIS